MDFTVAAVNTSFWVPLTVYCARKGFSETREEETAPCDEDIMVRVQEAVKKTTNKEVVPVVVEKKRKGRALWETSPEEIKNAFTIGWTEVSLPPNEANEKFTLSKSIYRKLYDHQQLSLSWLATLYLKGEGALLADDMGLGKTVQIAVFLGALWKCEIGRHFLIAVPVSLIECWKREFAHWCPDVPVSVLYGSKKERHDALASVYKSGGVLLTSYDLVQHVMEDIRSVTKPSASAKKHSWDVVVLDEAHRVKNTASKAGKAIDEIQARSKFLLTGAPIQNSLTELWALMNICMPGLIGTQETFETFFGKPIQQGSKRTASPFEVELKDQLAVQLKNIIAPYFLRRPKDSVKEMKKVPETRDVICWLNMEPEQKRLYDHMESLTRDTEGNAFRTIHALRNMSSHPLMALSDDDFYNTLDKWAGESNDCMMSPRNSRPNYIRESTEDDPTMDSKLLQSVVTAEAHEAVDFSCKLRFLTTLLPSLQKKGHRCLIFSQSNKMLNLVQLCVLKPLGLQFVRMHSGLKPEERDAQVVEFESEKQVFAMCLNSHVGGKGLSLTSADRVIILDPSWNPVTDMQAIGRTHRLGQTKPVVVYRLLGSETIEDKMFRTQVYKQGIANTLLEEENQMRYFSTKELDGMFSEAKAYDVMEERGFQFDDKRMRKIAQKDLSNSWFSRETFPPDLVAGFSDYAKLFSALEDKIEVDDDEDVGEEVCVSTGILLSEQSDIMHSPKNKRSSTANSLVPPKRRKS